ncbi:MAG TPA: hypothetical protein VF469_36285 [Kofleriaceae bacterium]
MLPRMDVAVFVGFAVSGPLHTPVAVDDARGFANVFGDDVALGWDGDAGQVVRGNLGPAVRSFFRNGGRRCWIVRVAGAARSNRFPVPGLARWSGGALLPACATARSEGSWSDDLAVSASLAAQPIDLRALELGESGRAVSARLGSPDDVAPGDQLRVALGGTGAPILVAAIGDIDGDLVRFGDDATVWFTAELPVPPDPAALAVTWFPTGDPDGDPVPQPLVVAGQPRWDADTLAVPIVPPVPASPDDPGLEPGRLVRLRWGTEEVWLNVGDIVVVEDGSPLRTAAELRGTWSRRLPGLPPGPRVIEDPAGLAAERVRISLWGRRGTERPVRLDDLGLTPGHPSYVGALPTDRTLFASEPRFAPSDRDPGVRELAQQLQRIAGDAVDPREHYAALWRTVATPRFPLAITAPVADAFVPIAMPLLPAAYLGARAPGDTALARDGLAALGPELFLDPDLADEPAETLLAEADFLRWQSSAPRPLTGIHAALGVDEATLIAVPDAVHRGWAMASEAPPAVLAPPVLVAALADGQTWQLAWNATGGDGASYTVQDAASAELTGPEVVWTGTDTTLRVTDRPPGRRWFRVRATRGSAVSPWSNAIALPIPPPQFQDCPAGAQLPAPVITALPPDARGSIELSWTEVPGADRYTVEELVGGDDVSTTIYQGRDHALTLRGRPPGAYSYRVRAEQGTSLGAWSSAATQIVSPPRRNLVARVSDFQPDQVLRPVHRAVMRLAAARGDLLAVLALPEHFRAPEAAAHVAWLRDPASEESGWSYAALYHPWLIGDDDPGTGPLQHQPPDGAVCGMIGQRASARGAWIAPANEPLRGVVELTPILPRDDWSRFADTQVNLISDEPHGILALGADTLARDPDLTAIHVRRLLILLRRIALRVGPGYVFEPNGAAFQRLVHRGFEAVLDDLFARGAFAGDARDAAYQLVVDATASVADQGRFVVEMKVAPAQPMSFLTVRLIQSGDLGVVTEAR